MKRKRLVKCTSAVLVLCMVLTCISFAFSTVGAATDNNAKTEVSASNSGNDNFTWDNATVYFLLTDRFKNGNKSNDHSYSRATDANENPLSGWDSAPGTFHGGDFAGITQTIEDGYFDDLGVNALWISAPYEQIHGYVDSGKGFAHYSYHGYYVLDYTETDANFGTKEEFEKLVDTAHEHGIRVIMDIVMNHTGYNNVKDMETYNYGTLLDGASEFKYKLDGVSAVNSHIDFKSSASDWGRWWGTDWIRSGLPGYSEGAGNDLERCLEGLPDFRTESTKNVGIPELLKTKWTKENTYNQKIAKYGSSNTVSGYLTTWLAEWVEKYGVDGFRCDTAKHVEFASWKKLSDKCTDALEVWRRNNPGKAGADWDEEFWMTGECWDHTIGSGYDGYFTQGGFDSMINFETTGAGILSKANLANIYSGYASSINTNDKFNQLSYISSHDSTLARGDMIYNGSALLLLPGGVQIFYGDETNRPVVPGLAFDGNGGSGHSLRGDMNWDSMDENVLKHWQKVGTFRNNHVSIGAGANTSLSATSGIAFGRTYSKNGVTDKAAAVVAASANSSVTIDVSDIWNEGQPLVNAYDQTSATVTGGKVTFNSGANGTILIQEPDGRPLMTVEGEAKFVGTQTVTVRLQECETAKCSVDGGNKFIVKDGTTFAIGNTAYDGDTIKVVLEGENERGSAKSTVTFQKVAQGSIIEQPTTGVVPGEKAELHVKTWDGSAPHAYVWSGTNTEHNGAWPGKQLTQKDSDGNYVLLLDTTESFNVVMNNGSGTQSGDITKLKGKTYLEVTNGSYATKVISTGNGGEIIDPSEESVVITIKPYDNNPINLYAWTGETAHLGAWPGKQLTEMNEDGCYVVTIPNTETCSAIISKDGKQTSDITGLSGEVLIEITSADCSTYKLTRKETPVSGVALLKQEAREVKAMTASDYTAASWSSVSSLMPSVDALVIKGAEADETAVQGMIEQLQTAKAGLKLVQPRLTYAVSGKTTIKGIAVADADVTVTVNGTNYKTKSDDVTGAFSVNVSSISSSSVIKIDVVRKEISCDTYSYNMSNGNIDNGETPTSPSIPVTQPTTQAPSTSPRPTVPQPTTAQPTTAQPTTAQPTTGPVVEDKITVNAGSNIFPAASQIFNKDEGKITVIYKLDSSMSVVDTQWTLRYDNTKLRYSAANNMSDGVQTIMPSVGNKLIFNANNNYLKGTFSNVSSLYEFKDDAFVSVTFDVIGTGNAEVYLDLEYLTLGYFKAENDIKIASIVDKGQLKNIQNIQGFGNASINTDTKITGRFILGDVDGDGHVKVQDVTLIMKQNVELITLTPTQKLAADVDGDGVVTVKDATKIQKFIAELISSL